VPRGVLVVNAMEINGKLLINCVIEEAFAPNPARPQYPLDCSADDPEFAKLRSRPAQVRPAGEKLYGALVSAKAGEEFFAQRRAVPPPAPAPLYIHIEPPDVERLPWEILCEAKQSFMALDPDGRWPIARLASASKRAEPLNRVVGNELRMAVVLAAARENGAAEWSSISAALSAFKTPIDVLGIVSEAASETAMTADAAQWAGKVPARNVTVAFVGDGSSLMSQLRAHVPNVIHFFCHGVADVRPQLELESRADRTKNADRGSIKLDSALLKELTSLKSLWLVVLNCCQGGKSAPQMHSLARDLVAGGVPAVVAMRESVDVNDANLFSEHFYPALFAQLQAVFTLKNRPDAPKPLPLDELVWVRAVDIARRQLSVSPPRQPDSSAEWTYPVVYVHRDELKLYSRNVRVPALTQERRLELLAELGMLRSVRSALDVAPDAEPAERNKLDAQIAQLEAQLAAP
jgi:hypothetical protein